MMYAAYLYLNQSIVKDSLLALLFAVAALAAILWIKAKSTKRAAIST
jgi:hypothetical protein